MNKYHKIVKDAVDEVLKKILGAEVVGAVRWAVMHDDETLPYADRLVLDSDNVSTF